LVALEEGGKKGKKTVVEAGGNLKQGWEGGKGKKRNQDLINSKDRSTHKEGKP